MSPTASRVEAADRLAAAGDLSGAVGELDAAANEAPDDADRAWCLHLGAAAARLAGDAAGAADRAARALALAAPGTPTWVAAQVEVGEAALAAYDGPTATAAFGALLALDGDVRLSGAGRAAVLRRRAAAHQLAGRVTAAAADLAHAGQLTAELTGAAAAGLPDRVARLALLVAAGDPAAEHEGLSVGVAAAEAGDHGVLADLALLDASRALDAGDPAAAADALARARDQARLAGDAVRYVGAAVAASDLAASRGDALGAYAPLATGWATLARVVGEDAAGAAFRPRLVALRDRLGAERFDAARRAYEGRRRPVADAGRG